MACSFSLRQDASESDLQTTIHCSVFRCILLQNNHEKYVNFLQTAPPFGLEPCERTYIGQVLRMLLPGFATDFDTTVEEYYPVLSRRRLFILLRLLEMIALKRQNFSSFYEEFVSHLKRHGRSIHYRSSHEHFFCLRNSYEHFICLRNSCEILSEPLISVQEMKTFLCWVLDCDESDEIPQEICDMYQREFPWYQPRPLKQQSVLAVRQCLRDANMLPHGIHQLGVPNQIKKIILEG